MVVLLAALGPAQPKRCYQVVASAGQCATPSILRLKISLLECTVRWYPLTPCPDPWQNLFEMRSFTESRVRVFLSVQLMRLSLDIVLLWYGILFLVYTVDLTELMLNAVALEVTFSLSPTA